MDINPNSVKICRLRLWIELLKNAYYKEVQKPARSKDADDEMQKSARSKDVDDNEERPYSVRASAFAELETLPNIDINIKEGNSLLSRFALDADLKEVLKNKKNIIEQYRKAVADYKNERNRDKKRELLKIIDEIKGDFTTEIHKNNPKMMDLAKKERRLFEINSPSLFEKYSEGEREVLSGNLEKQISVLNQEISDIKTNAIYKNAFEWRFEFPEVLDDDGVFTGFDIVIGNPPYIRQEELGTLKDYLKKDYEVYTGTADILVYFYELGLRVLKENGKFSFITSNKFMRANYGKPLRSFLGNYNLDEIIDFGDAPVFGGIAAYASIVNLQKEMQKPARSEDANDEMQKSARIKDADDGPEERPYSVRASANGGEHQTRVYTFPTSGDVPDFEASYKADGFQIAQKELTPNGWRLERTEVLDLLAKLRSKGEPLGEYVNGRFYRGITSGFNEAFVVDRETKERLIAEDSSSTEVLKPYLRGRDVKRWKVESQDLWLIFTRRGIEIEKFPAIKNYLSQFKNKLMPGIKGGRKPGSYEWFEIQDNSAYWQEFETNKIVYPDIVIKPQFAWDESKSFLGNTLYLIPTNEKFLLCFLNSKLLFWFYLQISPQIRGGYVRYIGQYVEQIPIPKIKEKDQ